MSDEPQSRRGPATLPLKPGQWNHVRLSLAATTVTLELNGQKVFKYQLRATNRRNFGLFHFADKTEARTRDVVMRGDWPQTLPALKAKLKERFSHDFSKNGMPGKYFRLGEQTLPPNFKHGPDGIRATISSRGDWSQVELIPHFSLVGDFDIEARFEQLNINQCDKEASIRLTAYMPGYEARMVRGRHHPRPQFLKGQLAVWNPDRTRTYLDSFITDEARSGRLRLSRRGNKVYSLFAEGDSTVFRIISEQTATDREVGIGGLQLVIVVDGSGQASVVWTNVTLRADRLRLPPDSN